MSHQEDRPEHSPWWIWTKRVLLVAAVLALIAVSVTGHLSDASRSMSLRDLQDKVQAGQVSEAVFSRSDDVVRVKLKGDGREHLVRYPDGAEAKVYEELQARGVNLRSEGPSLLSSLNWLAWLMVALALVFIGSRGLRDAMGRMSPGGGGDVGELMDRPTTTFDDVKGADEVVERTREMVAMISDPDAFSEVGAEPIKGVIFYGPPGTGKTLLARAIAGTANIPFYQVSAPELVNMWMGGSAKQIRKLFAKARSHPEGAIVFIDELDAIGGRRRGSSSSAADDERKSIVNQLLTELDGFDKNRKVLTVAATNRVESLDEALTRPGRFDLQLPVPLPDVRGREAILRLHAAGKPLADGVDLAYVAKQTFGMSGAQLKSLTNEAALNAARTGSKTITGEHFHEALETVQSGPKRTTRVTERDRNVTAWHEAGHAVAALFQPDMADPVRVTIVPRGDSGGQTWIDGDEDQLYLHFKEARARLVWMMGGRVAEKIHCGADNFSSGAAHDLQQATNLAMQMICHWGFGSYLSHISLDTWMQSPHAQQVERQVEALLDEAEAAAIELLLQHLPAMEQLVGSLLADEAVGPDQLQALLHCPRLDGPERDEVRLKYADVINSVRQDQARTPELV